mmetsp:Transcript_24534/g.73516  ORF Transcript_24534/g.73516 Transcript_24534/m.73516 type:complete len:155 (-) Transcript_24534:2371-2835(-)
MSWRYALAMAMLFCMSVLAAGGNEDTTEPGDDEKKSFFYFTFIDVWRFCVFWVCLWVGGKGAEAIRFPSLAGEIAVGIALGPHGADFVPFYPAIMMLGQVRSMSDRTPTPLHRAVFMRQGPRCGETGSVLWRKGSACAHVRTHPNSCCALGYVR